LVLLDILQQHYTLKIHRFIITCDCNVAGLKSFTYHHPPTANNDNYDLLTEALRSRPNQQSMQYTNGLRDTKRNATPPNNWTNLLNDEMDKLARQYWEETKDMNSPSQQIVSNQEWSAWINKRKITGDTLKTVQQHIQETEISAGLAADRKNGQEPRLSLHHQQLVNTTSIADAWKDIIHGQRKWLTKTSQRFAPVG
jgi:hypothetical protein